jgi:hypothetical protein
MHQEPQLLMDKSEADVWAAPRGLAALIPPQGLRPAVVDERSPLGSRFAYYYRQLRALPRRLRRLLQRRLRVSLTGAALLLAVHPAASQAATFEVKTASELTAAITAANATSEADTIILRQNITLTAVNSTTYGPTGLPVITGALTIAGGGQTLTRDSGAAEFRILAVGQSGELTLQQTVVSGGLTPSGSVPGDRGGAVFNRGVLRLTGSTLRGNTAVEGGGLYNNSAGAVTLFNSLLTHNVSLDRGGGIMSTTTASGTLSLQAVRIDQNSSYDKNNGVNIGGGALIISRNESRVTLDNCVITENSTGSQGSNGGGGLLLLAYDTSQMTVQQSTISGNHAGDAGGGMYVVADSGAVTITESTISGNGAGFGGGISGSVAFGGSLTIENSTISGNAAGGSGLFAGLGGGLLVFTYDATASVTVENSTITGNAAQVGGGIEDLLSSGSTRLSRNLIAGNSAGYGAEIDKDNVFPTGVVTTDYNVFGASGAAGVSGVTLGPHDIVPTVALGAVLNPTLADNGGSTLTHALVTGSPAIDAGGVDCPPPDVDQRGYGRPVGPACDIGAVEESATDARVAISARSGRALKVGSGRPNGTVQLAFTAAVSPALDLSQATMRLHHVLAEAGRELVGGLSDQALELRQEEATADGAMFETPAGVSPKVRVSLQVRQGVLEGTVRVDQAVLGRPQLCDGTTEVESELVVTDRLHPAIRVQLHEPWVCQTKKGAVTRLELSSR